MCEIIEDAVLRLVATFESLLKDCDIADEFVLAVAAVSMVNEKGFLLGDAAACRCVEKFMRRRQVSGGGETAKQSAVLVVQHASQLIHVMGFS